MFGIKDDGEPDDDDLPDDGGFQLYYGWLYNCKRVADFCNISIQQVYEMNIVEALNYLVILKEKEHLYRKLNKHAGKTE